MGVNVHIYLSGDTQIADVMDVVGILIGQNKENKKFDQDSGSYCNVKGVSRSFPSDEGKKSLAVYPESTHAPEYVLIQIPKNNFDKDFHSGSWFYECEIDNMRLISGGNNDFWRKIGTELIRFFGGYVDYNDCDDVDKDVEFPKPRKTNNTHLNEDFDKMRDDMLNLQAIM